MPLKAAFLYPGPRIKKQGTDLNPADCSDPSLDKLSWDEANSRQLNEYTRNTYLNKYLYFEQASFDVMCYVAVL